MKRLLIIFMLSIASIAEGSAQEHIDALVNRDIGGSRNGYMCTKRMAVKRDPDTGEITKRVIEFVTRDNKELAKQFIAAFKADMETAEVSEEREERNIYVATAVWLDPKRIYNISVTGDLVVVNVQTIYQEEK